MPYILQKDRKKYDDLIDFMIKHNLNPFKGFDDLLFEFCKQHIKPSYNNYKNFRGELSECEVEIKRRLFKDAKINFVSHNWKVMSDKDKDAILKEMAKIIKVDGDLNYTIFKLSKIFKEKDYLAMIYFHNHLKIAWERIGKELIEPYEDKKIKENGDVS